MRYLLDLFSGVSESGPRTRIQVMHRTRSKSETSLSGFALLSCLCDRVLTSSRSGRRAVATLVVALVGARAPPATAVRGPHGRMVRRGRPADFVRIGGQVEVPLGAAVHAAPPPAEARGRVVADVFESLGVFEPVQDPRRRQPDARGAEAPLLQVAATAQDLHAGNQVERRYYQATQGV